MENLIGMTENVTEYFKVLAKDAGNWSGEPLFDGGQVEKGYLIWMKKNKLIETFSDRGDIFVSFTAKGVEFAAELGIKLNR